MEVPDPRGLDIPFRQRTLAWIMNKLSNLGKKSTHPSISGSISDLAHKFERKIYESATSTQEYLHKIHAKVSDMLTMYLSPEDYAVMGADIIPRPAAQIYPAQQNFASGSSLLVQQQNMLSGQNQASQMHMTAPLTNQLQQNQQFAQTGTNQLQQNQQFGQPNQQFAQQNPQFGQQTQLLLQQNQQYGQQSQQQFVQQSQQQFVQQSQQFGQQGQQCGQQTQQSGQQSQLLLQQNQQYGQQSQQQFGQQIQQFGQQGQQFGHQSQQSGQQTQQFGQQTQQLGQQNQQFGQQNQQNVVQRDIRYPLAQQNSVSNIDRYQQPLGSVNQGANGQTQQMTYAASSSQHMPGTLQGKINQLRGSRIQGSELSSAPFRSSNYAGEKKHLPPFHVSENQHIPLSQLPNRLPASGFRPVSVVGVAAASSCPDTVTTDADEYRHLGLQYQRARLSLLPEMRRWLKVFQGQVLQAKNIVQQEVPKRQIIRIQNMIRILNTPEDQFIIIGKDKLRRDLQLIIQFYNVNIKPHTTSGVSQVQQYSSAHQRPAWRHLPPPFTHPAQTLMNQPMISTPAGNPGFSYSHSTAANSLYNGSVNVIDPMNMKSSMQYSVPRGAVVHNTQIINLENDLEMIQPSRTNQSLGMQHSVKLPEKGTQYMGSSSRLVTNASYELPDKGKGIIDLTRGTNFNSELPDKGKGLMDITPFTNATTNLLDKGKAPMDSTRVTNGTSELPDKGKAPMEFTPVTNATTNLPDKGKAPMDYTPVTNATSELQVTNASSELPDMGKGIMELILPAITNATPKLPEKGKDLMDPTSKPPSPPATARKAKKPCSKPRGQSSATSHESWLNLANYRSKSRLNPTKLNQSSSANSSGQKRDTASVSLPQTPILLVDTPCTPVTPSSVPKETEIPVKSDVLPESSARIGDDELNFEELLFRDEPKEDLVKSDVLPESSARVVDDKLTIEELFQDEFQDEPKEDPVKSDVLPKSSVQILDDDLTFQELFKDELKELNQDPEYAALLESSTRIEDAELTLEEIFQDEPKETEDPVKSSPQLESSAIITDKDLEDFFELGELESKLEVPLLDIPSFPPSPTVPDCIGQENTQPNPEKQPINPLLDAVMSVSKEALDTGVRSMKTADMEMDKLPDYAYAIEPEPAKEEDDLTIFFEDKHYYTVDDIEEPPNKKLKRDIEAVSRDMPYTAMPNPNCQSKSEVSQYLLSEIKEKNRKLFETVIEVVADSGNKGNGTVVRCTHKPIAMSEGTKRKFASDIILSVEFLVPFDYPNLPPKILDCRSGKLVGISVEMTQLAKTMFDDRVRCIDPLTVGEMAQEWEYCSRSTVSTYAKHLGADTFSSKFGGWERVGQAP